MSDSKKPQGWRRVWRNLLRIPQDLAKPYRKRQRRKLIASPPTLKSLETLGNKNDSGTILFLSPEAGVAPHFANTGFLARTMQEQGHDVLLARCFELFPRCPAMGSYQLAFNATPEEKRKVCESCLGFSVDFSKHFKIPTLDLRALDHHAAETICREELASAPQDLTQFSYDGVAFGQFSTIDLVLATKKHHLQSTDSLTRQKWIQLIHSSLKMYLLVDQLCKLKKLSTIVHHNDYSLLLGGRIAAAKHSVNVQGITLAYHKNIDQGRVVIYPTYWPLYNKQVADDWPRWRNQPIPADRVKEVVDDLVVRTSGAGSHIYSAARGKAASVVEQLKLDPNKKLLVAYTSSLDEYVASKMLIQAAHKLGHVDRNLIPELDTPLRPFPDQLSWLRQLVDFVRNRTDLQLAVRVHPREGSNHRESTRSEHLALLENEFQSLPENCRFIWPSDRTSSYDLGEAADVVLTSWSTIGIEMARLGVPVLAAFRITEAPYPTDDFLVWKESKEDYFTSLDAMLKGTSQLESWKHALRWYHYANLCVSVDVGDAAGPLIQGKPLPYRLPRNANIVEQAILGKKPVTESNLDELVATPESNRSESERSGLIEQLSRLIHYLLTGDDQTPKTMVNAGAAIKNTFHEELNGRNFEATPGQGRALLSFDSNRVHYQYFPASCQSESIRPDSKTEIRQTADSPMVVRLTKMLFEAQQMALKSKSKAA